MGTEYEVSWGDVKDAARSMFNIWVGQPELRWAEEVWGHFGAAGLTTASNAVDETEVYLRLVTLALVYQEFCGLAWDEQHDRSADEMVWDVEIDPVALGILAAEAGRRWYADEKNGDELRNIALTVVTDNLKDEIYQCLLGAYGSVYELYVRMCKTGEPDQDEDDEDEAVQLTSFPSTMSQGEQMRLLAELDTRAYQFVDDGFNS